jgi:hypothetical protein
VIRLGTLPSSPFQSVELFGGDATREMFRKLLCDERTRGEIFAQDAAFIERLNRLDDGPAVLHRIAEGDLPSATVIDRQAGDSSGTAPHAANRVASSARPLP